MPVNGHHRYPEPTGGAHQSAILLELLWHWPGVSVLYGPLPGSWPNSSIVDSTYVELLSYGLLHRDHGQYLRGWSDSPESPTAERVHYRGHGHVATSYYGELAGNCQHWPGPQATGPATSAHCPWSPQMRPKMPQQQAPTPGRQEVMPATPYRQQVFPPKSPASKLNATPSTSQDQGDPAGEAGGTRGRSSSRGPQDGQRRSRSSTRGSRKHQRTDPTDSLMEWMANYVPSGWKRDLTHFIGSCWEVQIGSLERNEWRVAITKFLGVMAKKKNHEWTDIKELMPLQFMPYVAKLFREVTGQDLPGLGHFTRWIGLGGYYHWRVVQQGLIHLVPHLAGQPMPREPDTCPSGKPLPKKPAQTETPSTGASGKWLDRTQPAPGGSGQAPAPNQSGRPPTSGQSRKSSTPRQSGGPASTGRSKTQTASGGPSNHPLGRGGAGDGTGTDWYQMYMHETQGGISEPPAPPYPVGMAEVRKEAIGHIYDRVAGKEPPTRNIASRALQAYYTRVDPQTLSTWACQILCMIAEYHMACMTQGSAVTSSILPRQLAKRLPPLADYTHPEDRSGATDVRIRDHRARTLRVAVLCHQLDMALSEDANGLFSFSFGLWLFAGFLVPSCLKRALVLGNGCEKVCASRSLLGSYIHQKSI